MVGTNAAIHHLEGMTTMCKTCECPLNADDFETLADVDVCGKPAVTTRVIEGLAMSFCADCLRAYEASLIEDATAVGFEWYETVIGVEVRAGGMVLHTGQRPECINWLRAQMDEEHNVSADLN